MDFVNFTLIVTEDIKDSAQVNGSCCFFKNNEQYPCL